MPHTPTQQTYKSQNTTPKNKEKRPQKHNFWRKLLSRSQNHLGDVREREREKLKGSTCKMTMTTREAFLTERIINYTRTSLLASEGLCLLDAHRNLMMLTVLPLVPFHCLRRRSGRLGLEILLSIWKPETEITFIAEQKIMKSGKG